jgi:hypothetical protein
MTYVGRVLVEVEHPIGSKVHIDGDKSITAMVTGVLFYGYGALYEVSWFNEGVVETEKLDTFRLERAS